MTAHLLPVEGLYESREDGERAALAVRDGGLGQVTVRPLSEINLGLLPTDPAETKKRMTRCILAIPVGFIVLAPNGIAVFLVAGPLLGILAGLLLGAIGAIVAFLLMDRPPERYRQLAKKDGVLVTVSCEQDVCPKVLQVLGDTHPAELFGPHHPR